MSTSGQMRDIQFNLARTFESARKRMLVRDPSQWPEGYEERMTRGDWFERASLLRYMAEQAEHMAWIKEQDG